MILFDPQIYQNALNFADLMINREKANNLDKYDVVHNLFLLSNVNINNYKSLIITEIKSLKNKNELSFEESYKKSTIENYRVCKLCGFYGNEGYFKAGFNYKRNVQQYRSTCNTCNNSIKKKYKMTKNAQKRALDKQKIKRQLLKQMSISIPDQTRNERVRRYWNKEKEKISDAYVKKIIKRRFKGNITDEMISYRRTKIIDFRIKKNLSYTITI